jgi:hypothetical protein
MFCTELHPHTTHNGSCAYEPGAIHQTFFSYIWGVRSSPVGHDRDTLLS